MFKKLRKKHFNRSMYKFLKRYLSEIGLGEVKSMDESENTYIIKTAEHTYTIKLKEDLGNVKLFYIMLSENGVKSCEGILIQVWGKVIYRLIPIEIVIDNNNERQITNLITLETAVYTINEKTRENVELVRRSRQPFCDSKSVQMSKLVEISRQYSRH